MTDHNREELIERATWALIDYDTDVADRGVRDEHYRERRADAERVLAVFEQAHAPTDDEREALRDAFDEMHRITEGGCDTRGEDVADMVIALGFRRTVQGEPTGYRAILIQKAREHADEWRRYDDTEDLVGTLVEMANMLASIQEPQGEPTDAAEGAGQPTNHERQD